MKRAAQNKHDKALAEHAEWEWHFTQLAEFVRRHGHADLGPHPVTDWLHRQCHVKRLKTLSSSRQQRLRDLGIDLEQDIPLPAEESDDEKRTRRGQDPKKIALWETRYAELCAYQAEHGHTNVTKSQNRILGHWRDVQREFRRKGMLKPDRIARLEAIGFEWEAPGRHGRSHQDHLRLSWEEQFQRLTAFKERFGHCHVPTQWAEDLPLGAWAAAQRQHARKGLLAADRHQRLDALGFPLGHTPPFRTAPFKTPPLTAQKRDVLWTTRYAELCAYQAQHGHTNVTESQDRALAIWREVQRTQRRRGKLSPDRTACLDAIGFEWEAPGLNGRPQKVFRSQLWEQYFAALDAYQQRFGHCEVPRHSSEHPALAKWVHAQRHLNYHQSLNPVRFARLDALGFAWTTRNNDLIALWETRYAELCAYQAQHGHTNVTKSQNRTLGHWREVQREFRRKGMLKPDRIARLEAIGFEWEAPGRKERSRHEWHLRLWDEHFQCLQAFKDRFGHCHVPVLWEEDLKLGQWVSDQRKLHRRGKLPADRIQRLDAIGFVWKPPARFFQPPFPAKRRPPKQYVALWEQRYSELCAYRAQHGHTNVTQSQNPVLSNWRDVQREFRRKGKLSPERIARLDAIGFEWEGPNRNGRTHQDWARQRWDEHLTRLTAFKERFGHAQVPLSWPEDTPLATWVADQRKAKRKGRLPADRCARLDALGFDWQPTTRPMRSDRGKPRPAPAYAALWDQRYAHLSTFHQQHGHTRIPNNRPAVLKLCKWCYSQRARRRQGTLSADRIARLDALGFDWDNPSSPGRTFRQHQSDRWDAHYNRLTAFHQRFGHSRVPVSWVEDKQLVTWVEKQRKAAREGKLSGERRARLEALRFIWKPDSTPVFSPRPDQHGPKPAHDAIWLRHLENLRAFHQQHGHFRPSNSQEGKLHSWCAAQRKARRRGTLTPNRLARLEALGFE